MANGNGNGNKRNQYIGVGTAILLAGGGGGLIGANTHRHPETDANTENIHKVETNQAVIKRDIEYIKEKVSENSRKTDEVLRLLREGRPPQ